MINKKYMSYSIKQISKLTGLPSSTLRYYESVGVIQEVKRDDSSKHRKYSETDLENIYTISCLYAANMSMKSIKKYFDNMKQGESGINEQINLFATHIKKLEEEIKLMEVRKDYVNAKLAYWKAVKTNDKNKINKVLEQLKSMARKLIGLNR